MTQSAANLSITGEPGPTVGTTRRRDSAPKSAFWRPAGLIGIGAAAWGVVLVIDAAHGFKTVQTVTTQKGARTMIYDPTADRIYLVTAEFGSRPEPTAASPHPRPSIVPGSFTVLALGR